MSEAERPDIDEGLLEALTGRLAVVHSIAWHDTDTINDDERLRASLKAVLRAAYDNGIIEINPMAGWPQWIEI